VSVNLPLDLLLAPDLPGVLRGALGGSALPPGALVLELTETHRIEDRAALARALTRLRQAGHRVLLDDILADDPRGRLFDLPFAGLKLDRTLVAALPRDARQRHALRRVTRGAEARGQVVVAEGVSSAATMALLADLGVHWAQGFAIGRPLPAGALPGWSARWRARGAG
jgi:EAL domain-containing protein (putative c-di-GMP-specific phosphodiesterase class I)